MYTYIRTYVRTYIHIVTCEHARACADRPGYREHARADARTHSFARLTHARRYHDVLNQLALHAVQDVVLDKLLWTSSRHSSRRYRPSVKVAYHKFEPDLAFVGPFTMSWNLARRDHECHFVLCAKHMFAIKAINNNFGAYQTHVSTKCVVH